jgi:hypothetical protein
LLFDSPQITPINNTIVDNNDWTYSLSYPIKSTTSKIELFNLDELVVNELNNRKLIIAWKTISNWNLDITLNWNKLNSSNPIFTWDDWYFSFSSDNMLNIWNQKLGLKVTPSWSSWSVNSSNLITVTHTGISSSWWLNTDSLYLTTQWNIWESEYDISITDTIKPVNLIKYSTENIYPTKYPIIIWWTKPNTIIEIYSWSTIVWKTISDKYWLFEFRVKNKLENWVYSYTFKVNWWNDKVYNFTINTNSVENSVNITNVFSNKLLWSESIILRWYWKPNSIIEISKQIWSNYIKIWNAVIDEYGSFEYIMYNQNLSNWVNNLKFLNKSTLLNKFLSFEYSLTKDCSKYDCYSISNLWVLKNNYLFIEWFTKKTILNKSVIYAYYRKINESENQKKIIWVISSDDNWIFNFKSLEKLENWEYIISLEWTLGNMIKEYYLNTSNKNNVYLYNEKKLNNSIFLKWYINTTLSNIKYKNINLDSINSIDYWAFNNISLDNNNWYFEKNIYTTDTWSIVIIATDINNDSYIKLINK